MAFEFQVTFDCADPGALAEFWAAALGYVVQPPPEGFDSWDAALEAWGIPADQRNNASAIIDPAGAGPRVFFQKVPKTKSAKNRVHLDLRAAAGKTGAEAEQELRSQAERLVGLGATVHHEVPAGSPPNDFFIVMQDPEGNEFCLD